MRKLSTLNIIVTSLVALCVVSCEAPIPEFVDFEPQLVVDGEITVGETPVVVLTQLLSPQSAVEGSDINKLPVAWGKVTISCGDKEEVMIGSRSDKYISEFYYRALHIKGEEGKNYTIRAEYDGVVAEATTTMLARVEAKVWCESVNPKDDTYIIKARVDDPTPEGDYYLISSRIEGHDTIFKPTLLGVWSDSVLNNQDNTIPVFNSLSVREDTEDMGMYYKKGDIVDIEIAHISKELYECYQDMQDMFINANNIFYPAVLNARTNVKGGIGVWAAKAASYHRVIVN